MLTENLYSFYKYLLFLDAERNEVIYGTADGRIGLLELGRLAADFFISRHFIIARKEYFLYFIIIRSNKMINDQIFHRLILHSKIIYVILLGSMLKKIS